MMQVQPELARLELEDGRRGGRQGQRHGDECHAHLDVIVAPPVGRVRGLTYADVIDAWIAHDDAESLRLAYKVEQLLPPLRVVGIRGLDSKVLRFRLMRHTFLALLSATALAASAAALTSA